MTSKHLAASMAALNSAGAAAAAPIAASVAPGTAYDASLAAARKAGAAEERVRIESILNHEAATGRGKLAAHLALKTAMTVEDAADMLAASATEGSTNVAATGAASNVKIDWAKIVAGVNAALPGAQAKEATR